MVTPTDARTLIERSRDDPAFFWDSVLGAEPYPKQLEIIQALKDHQRVAVVGCNGSGKDWMSARIMLWWQSVHYPAITVVVGPTHRQVSDIVWKEARSAYLAPRFPLGGRMYQTARWEHDDRHYALGLAVGGADDHGDGRIMDGLPPEHDPGRHPVLPGVVVKSSLCQIIMSARHGQVIINVIT